MDVESDSGIEPANNVTFDDDIYTEQADPEDGEATTVTICIIHRQLYDTDKIVEDPSPDAFIKIIESRSLHLSLPPDHPQRLDDICSQIPDLIFSSKHSYHQQCYRYFCKTARLAKVNAENTPKANSKFKRAADTDVDVPDILYQISPERNKLIINYKKLYYYIFFFLLYIFL